MKDKETLEQKLVQAVEAWDEADEKWSRLSLKWIQTEVGSKESDLAEKDASDAKQNEAEAARSVFEEAVELADYIKNQEGTMTPTDQLLSDPLDRQKVVADIIADAASDPYHDLHAILSRMIDSSPLAMTPAELRSEYDRVGEIAEDVARAWLRDAGKVAV